MILAGFKFALGVAAAGIFLYVAGWIVVILLMMLFHKSD